MIAVESGVMGVFVVAASLGFRRSLWLVVAGLAAHGVQDFFHARLVANPGVPAWWPAFCGTYDVVAAGYLAWRLTRHQAGPVPGAAGDVTVIPRFMFHRVVKHPGTARLPLASL